jgi:hypothetical protein
VEKTMPALVVIRGGSKTVEYQENRSSWRRPRPSDALSGSDSDSDSDSSDAEAERRLRESEAAVSAAYGPSSELREAEGMCAFRCAECGSVVADRADVVSKTFYGRTGKAFLMNSM